MDQRIQRRKTIGFRQWQIWSSFRDWQFSKEVEAWKADQGTTADSSQESRSFHQCQRRIMLHLTRRHGSEKTLQPVCAEISDSGASRKSSTSLWRKFINLRGTRWIFPHKHCHWRRNATFPLHTGEQAGLCRLLLSLSLLLLLLSLLLLLLLSEIITIDFAGARTTINSEYYSNLVKETRSRRRKPRKADLWILHDNAPIHSASHTTETLDKCSFRKVIHPPYSPDLAPSDFYMFQHLKRHLAGTHFANPEEVKEAVQSFFASKLEAWFRAAFDELVVRWKKCLANNGSYIEKWFFFFFLYLYVLLFPVKVKKIV